MGAEDEKHPGQGNLSYLQPAVDDPALIHEHGSLPQLASLWYNGSVSGGESQNDQ